MRFHVIPAIGIIGGLVMGCVPFQGSSGNAVLTYERPSLNRSQKVVILPLKESALSDPGLTPLDDDVTEIGELINAMESSSESRLRYKLTLLERGRFSLRRINDYTALMRKQEVVRGELLDEQTIAIKCRHHPFSVYLAWEIGDVGREVIYVDGKNNGKLLAHDGGWKSRLPAFSMSTDGAMAMKDTRCPVTTAGLLGLTDALIAIHQHDLKQSDFASCEIEAGRQFDGRRCSMFTKNTSPQRTRPSTGNPSR